MLDQVNKGGFSRNQPNHYHQSKSNFYGLSETWCLYTYLKMLRNSVFSTRRYHRLAEIRVRWRLVQFAVFRCYTNVLGIAIFCRSLEETLSARLMFADIIHVKLKVWYLKKQKNKSFHDDENKSLQRLDLESTKKDRTR